MFWYPITNSLPLPTTIHESYVVPESSLSVETSLSSLENSHPTPPPSIPSHIPNKSITSEVPQPSSSISTPLEYIRDRDKEPTVYSRRNKTQPPQQHHSPELSAKILGNTGNSSIPNICRQLDLANLPGLSDVDIPIANRKVVRSCIMHPMSNHVSYKKLSPALKAFVVNFSSYEPILSTIQEAFSAPRWKQAIFEEMGTLKKNGTWELVDLPLRKRPVGCK